MFSHCRQSQASLTSSNHLWTWSLHRNLRCFVSLWLSRNFFWLPSLTRHQQKSATSWYPIVAFSGAVTSHASVELHTGTHNTLRVTRPAMALNVRQWRAHPRLVTRDVITAIWNVLVTSVIVDSSVSLEHARSRATPNAAWKSVTERNVITQRQSRVGAFFSVMVI